MGKEVLFKGVETIAEYKTNIDFSIREFLEKYNLQKVIAISGGADNKHEENVICVLRDFIDSLHDYRFAILTGGTKGGIPELGLQIAKEAHIPTIGVFPGKAVKDVLFDKLDLALEAYPPAYGGPDWGTETSTFVQLVNGIIVIGGGLGTLVEVTSALKINVSRIRKEQEPIYVCPIAGTGGVADMIGLLPDIQKVIPSLPSKSIITGLDAAEFITRNLFSKSPDREDILTKSSFFAT